MKRTILSISLVLTGLIVNAQNKLEATGFAGVGISTPQHLMHVKGNHSNTRLLLHSVGGGIETRYADLMLWASEPGLTYSGVGIGNNVINLSTSPYLTRISNERGASYMRLLEENIMFNVITKSGNNINALNINSDGFVGIGTTTPKTSLQIQQNNDGTRTSVKDLVYLTTSHSDVGYNGFGTGIVDYRRTYQNSTPHAVNRISFIERGHSTADRGGAITFSTKELSSGSAAPLERMRVDYNGNVGIGTTTPSAKLDINGGHLYVGDEVFENPTSWGQTINIDDNVHSRILIEERNTGVKTSLWAHTGGNARVGTVSNHDFGIMTNNSAKVMIKSNGNVGIGTTTTGIHKLAVEGSIGAREIKVQATGWYDFVFEKDYNLPTIEEVENHIKEKGHLKDIPSEKEVLENGIHLGEMNGKLLQKIEELTLYTIQQEKKIKEQEKKIKKQEEQLKSLKDLSDRLYKLEKLLKSK
ncbi:MULTISPECIES: hypothetical protein [unclassified Tenacibaculum]|uniref:hypothetical protein n=1 Tax=unclassified Tenacibaculum TaxID=2635139 RepID=UPI001F3D4EC3|nr:MULTISPECIES: hypothetical protein [unclassified Tenacibaculum]MCF2875044.1 hypothetical protein [Tenacibaculum sp. Cn5-1]MCF2935120.1 hypothetical protein [Tenacibaculum sp. Cn5-34]MCG7511438.1 hypothetical protein [Tenacibaculum sp. Cn5-46]